MKRIILLFLVLTGTLSVSAQDKLFLEGRIKDAVTKRDLVEAVVLLPDSSGNKLDSVAAKAKTWRDGEIIEISNFYLTVPRRDSTYVFDVMCDGYRPQTVSYRVENVGKRERYREIPMILLERAPRELKEVTVVASKIKFYNRGDTIVFNADAFQLAEGSMLDALIAQLPGVELNDDGQIRVDGQFVESLLLNGKEFLDGDNRLMLDNIAAYTVKNVEIYQGQSLKDRWARDDMAPKQLTMDVKLKREYNAGWIGNAQAGLGTHDRYQGRLFARWFTETHTLTLLGNVNNLNDNRTPGKSDTWTPDMMPDGTRSYRLATAGYGYSSPDEHCRVSTTVKFEQTLNNDYTTTERTNFLENGDTYENSFARSRSRDTRLDSKGSVWLRNGRHAGYLDLTANYRRRHNEGRTLAATFDSEQSDIDREVVETLYTEADPARLEAVINRSDTRTDGSSKSIDLRATPGGNFMLGSGDRISFETYFRYNSVKEQRWDDYTVNYGSDPAPSIRRRQYFDNSPNRIITSVNNLSYRMSIRRVFLSLNYEYRFSSDEKDSYMYALERLTDMGAFGILPAGYLDAFDPANSYTSRNIENKHSLEPTLSYNFRNDKCSLYLTVSGALSLKHQHLDYWRDGRSYLIKQTSFIVKSGYWDTFLDFGFGPMKNEKGETRGFRHDLEYHLTVEPTTPNPFHRLDVVNDADPLNITLGNPDLKTAYEVKNSLEYSFEPREMRHPVNLSTELSHTFVDKALTRGYTYDTSTGVRTTRTYNVDGNRTFAFANTLRLQFGRRNQFTLSSITDASVQRYADMIGVDMQQPEKSIVSTRILGEKLNFGWQIGRQSLNAKLTVTGRRSTSSRPDFVAIDARHVSYGFNGSFILPAGFGLSTDLTLYNRHGYGMSAIDGRDLVWNARLSYNPSFARQWVLMLDGFDMLHQLSNVDYAVNAAGRVVSYSNALPRYIMFSVQYRFNKQPRKHK